MHVYVQTFILLMMVDSPWIRFKLFFKKNKLIYSSFKKQVTVKIILFVFK